MTSDFLLGKNQQRLEDVHYCINAEGGVKLPVTCGLCVSVEDADQTAISHAMEFARTFTSVTLYKKVLGRPKEVLYNSAIARMSRNKNRGIFHSVGYGWLI